jgi:hypothetical protein
VNQNRVKLKLKSSRFVNAFYQAFVEFYGALRAGRPAPEGAQAGYDVIDYCERTVRDATLVGESKVGESLLGESKVRESKVAE